MPKVSIITICYNEPNLEKTCESIVNQTYQDFEWIVVDGGSNQETLAVFEKYKHRIDTFISEKDNGRYDAMNKGIRLAKGEYLQFLNAGDYYSHEDILSQVVAGGLDKDLVYGDLITTDGWKVKFVPIPKEIDFRYLYLASIAHPSTFIKKELFEKYGLYDESYKIVSDWEKWIVFILLNHCSYKHVDVAVSVYNLDGISSKYLDLNAKERDQVLRKYFSAEQLEKIKKQIEKEGAPKMTDTFAERLFSIKNNPSKTRMIITILGIKFKMRRKNEN